MSARLPTGVLVSALLRRVSDAGGMAVVLARGDAQAGAVLVVASERGGEERLLERGIGADGEVALIESKPGDGAESYWRRRRSRDPDLWVVALDVAQAERFAVETLLGD